MARTRGSTLGLEVTEVEPACVTGSVAADERHYQPSWSRRVGRAARRDSVGVPVGVHQAHRDQFLHERLRQRAVDREVQ